MNFAEYNGGRLPRVLLHAYFDPDAVTAGYVRHMMARNLRAMADKIERREDAPADWADTYALTLSAEVAPLETVVQIEYVGCQDCEWTGDIGDVSDKGIRDIFERVSPGEVMPAGECPKCGALVHLIDEEDARRPISAGDGADEAAGDRRKFVVPVTFQETENYAGLAMVEASTEEEARAKVLKHEWDDFEVGKCYGGEGMEKVEIDADRAIESEEAAA